MLLSQDDPERLHRCHKGVVLKWYLNKADGAMHRGTTLQFSCHVHILLADPAAGESPADANFGGTARLCRGFGVVQQVRTAVLHLSIRVEPRNPAVSCMQDSSSKRQYLYHSSGSLMAGWSNYLCSTGALGPWMCCCWGSAPSLAQAPSCSPVLLRMTTQGMITYLLWHQCICFGTAPTAQQCYKLPLPFCMPHIMLLDHQQLIHPRWFMSGSLGDGYMRRSGGPVRGSPVLNIMAREVPGETLEVAACR